MEVNGKKLDIDSLTKDVYNDKSMIKMRGNGIYLSDNQIEVLKRYDIDYKKYISLNSLIFEIEEILNEEDIYNNSEFTGYHKKISIKDYVLIVNDTTKQKDVVKEITVEISYKLGNKEKNVKISTYIAKE